MSHYQYARYSELAKDDWNSIYNLIEKSLKEKIYDYNSLKNIESQLIKNNSNDILYSPKKIKHVLGAERGFISKKLNLKDVPHSELMAYYNNIIFEDYKLDIIQALDKNIDIYVSYYNWFINALFVDYLPINKLKEVVVKLCKESASELDKNIELLSLYGTFEIIDGNIKKGLAIFDDLFSRDQFNLLMYLRLLDILKEEELFKYLDIYGKKAIDIAITLEDNEACQIIENFLEQYKDEISDSNELSLLNMINFPPKKEEVQSLLFKLAISRFPKEGKIVLDENLNDMAKVDSFEIIKNYCKTCLLILQDSQLKEKFIDLSLELDEIQAVNTIMENI